MKIGFLSNQIDSRGTGHAVYDYAHYNEEILGNESKIFTLDTPLHDLDMVDRYVTRFHRIYTPSAENLKDCDALYHIKSGKIEAIDFSFGAIPYLVHAVFESEPHGHRYACISEWMGLRDKLDFVPHIIHHEKGGIPDGTLRKALKIPHDAVVFGRYGGVDTFDLPFVWDAIQEVLDAREDVWFVFVNTMPRIGSAILHDRIKYFPKTLVPEVKTSFVKTCNAMLHARQRGETFGISVGEFSSLGKPVFTYGDSYEKAHIFELKGTAKTYKTREELIDLMRNYHGESAHPFYTKYTPELVMTKFKEVFLD